MLHGKTYLLMPSHSLSSSQFSIPPVIAFCTTCKGRTQHLAQTLLRNMQDNPYPYVKFVVLDYNSQDNLLSYLKQCFSLSIECEILSVYSYPKPTTFHMAHAKNMAHRLGILEGADILVNMDADNYTGPGFGEYIRNSFLHHPDSFLWGKMVKDAANRLPRGISGRIAVTRHAFLNAGGYDEKFDCHGPDDKDFNARLLRLGYEGIEIASQYLRAILHNDRMRFKEYPHAANAGEEQFQIDRDTTVVNYGDIGTGTVYKNFDYSRPITLAPVPTRIFGIGMHKTATTSLHNALSILGFDSAHWRSAHWAKAIWKQMRDCGRSRTLERHYALCDLPIPLFYRELDEAYPGSKFILTVRSEHKWLRSVANHWDPNSNPYRGGWNHDPFTHKVHRELYGQKWFDADIFLERYRRHNAEVLEYFRERPDALCVINMDTDDVWAKLCPFLDRPIPDQPYPHSLRTKEPVH
jgi:hypothetical protein